MSLKKDDKSVGPVNGTLMIIVGSLSGLGICAYVLFYMISAQFQNIPPTIKGMTDTEASTHWTYSKKGFESLKSGLLRYDQRKYSKWKYFELGDDFADKSEFEQVMEIIDKAEEIIDHLNGLIELYDTVDSLIKFHDYKKRLSKDFDLNQTLDNMEKAAKTWNESNYFNVSPKKKNRKLDPSEYTEANLDGLLQRLELYVK